MNKRRIAAMFLIIAGVIIGDFAALFPPAEQLEARNETDACQLLCGSNGPKPAVVCGIMGCTGNNPGGAGVKGGVKGSGPGGGVIFVK